MDYTRDREVYENSAHYVASNNFIRSQKIHKITILIYIIFNSMCVKEAEKKVLLLMAGLLRGGEG